MTTALPPEVLAHARRTGTSIETATTIYEAYLERQRPLTPEHTETREQVPA